MGFLNLTPKVGGGYTGYYGVEDYKPLNQGIFTPERMPISNSPAVILPYIVIPLG